MDADARAEDRGQRVRALHSRSKSGSHVRSVRGRLRRAWNTARVPRRLVLVTFPLALCAGIGDAGICRVYDSWIVPDPADTSVNVVIRSSGSTVDSPLRCTGVLNYHDLGGRHTPPAAGARPVVRDARRGGSRGGTLPSRSGSTPFAELVARPSDGHTRGLRLHLRWGQLCLPPDGGRRRASGNPPAQAILALRQRPLDPPSRRPGPARARARRRRARG